MDERRVATGPAWPDPVPAPDWTRTIGWIKPGPVSKTIDQFFRVTPPDVNVVISTTMWSLKLTDEREFDPASVRDGQVEMVAIARDLVTWGPMDFLAVTGDLYQAALGPAWNAELRAAVEAATGVPAATAMTAAADAMHELGVTRIAIGTTVSEGKSAAVRAYLEASGLEVPAVVGHPTTSGREIRTLPVATP